jgi:hypothetical protein
MWSLTDWGLLNTSTARYFYKVSKSILHNPTVNSEINITNLYTNIIYNFYNKAYSVKQTVFKKHELFFEKLHFLQNLECNS